MISIWLRCMENHETQLNLGECLRMFRNIRVAMTRFEFLRNGCLQGPFVQISACSISRVLSRQCGSCKHAWLLFNSWLCKHRLLHANPRLANIRRVFAGLLGGAGLDIDIWALHVDSCSFEFGSSSEQLIPPWIIDAHPIYTQMIISLVSFTSHQSVTQAP